MGLKPSQGELNVALKPVFAHIDNVHLIHDDVIIATKNIPDHINAVKVMEAVSWSGLTLNPDKCHFGCKEIKFWGMIYSAEGMRPDPSKVDALKYISPPSNKDDLVSFLCMMQSNADFIENFAKKAAPLQELTEKKAHFKWTTQHQKYFDQLIQDFRKDTLLRYFDMKKKIYIFTDAHISGLGAILAQGDNYQDAKPIVIASRTTSNTEKRYPQLDLEATAIDFALRRFRNYVVGAPNVEIITDHKPLCPIFNKYRQGSIRTDRIKLRHQDINYQVIYQRGKLNQSDYLSRHGKPFELIPETEQKETEDLHNLLYTLHTTPIIDNIGITTIAKETKEDSILAELMKIIRKGQNWIPKGSPDELKRFKSILDEITITGNDILMKSDRTILPLKLQREAISLAHKESHPGVSQMERRLRCHFFFHDMQQKVLQYVDSCIDCKAFVDKKTSEPLCFQKVPSKNWEVVAVDLYGPMPSNNHVVVVQDLGLRFLAAKLVSSTKSANVLPALEEIYNAYGNPNIQISDNGPPFTSKAMQNFTKSKNIAMQTIASLHPSSNPVETLMCPLGKTMKIAHLHHQPEKKALEEFLQNYRDTPHPVTGVSPSAMLF